MREIIYRLVYYSRNQIIGDAVSFDKNITAILAKSRTNNVRDEITGALLFNAGCFAQVLEGALNKIEATFERIQQDERHGEVSLLALDVIEQRSFPNWAMGFVGNCAENAERFSEIAQSSGFSLDRLSGDQLHTLLKDLTIAEETEAA
jgi:hypothetical protein